MVADRKGVDRGVRALDLLAQELVEAVPVDAGAVRRAVEAADAAPGKGEIVQVDDAIIPASRSLSGARSVTTEMRPARVFSRAGSGAASCSATSDARGGSGSQMPCSMLHSTCRKKPSASPRPFSVSRSSMSADSPRI